MNSKKRRIIVVAGDAESRGGCGDFFDIGADCFFVERLPVYLHAFAEADEVRRGVKAGAVAGGAVNRFEHGGGRAFAVGAGDVDRRECVFRIAERAGEEPHAVDAEFRAVVFQREKECLALGVCHRSMRGTGADNAHCCIFVTGDFGVVALRAGGGKS